MIITSAGPLSNLALAFVIACIGRVVLDETTPEKVSSLFVAFIFINCLLFLFNMIPVPPLDGSHFLKRAIRMREETYAKFARYGFIIILLLLNFGGPIMDIFYSILIIISEVFIVIMGTGSLERFFELYQR